MNSSSERQFHIQSNWKKYTNKEGKKVKENGANIWWHHNLLPIYKLEPTNQMCLFVQPQQKPSRKSAHFFFLFKFLVFFSFIFLFILHISRMRTTLPLYKKRKKSRTYLWCMYPTLDFIMNEIALLNKQQLEPSALIWFL